MQTPAIPTLDQLNQGIIQFTKLVDEFRILGVSLCSSVKAYHGQLKKEQEEFEEEKSRVRDVTATPNEIVEVCLCVSVCVGTLAQRVN